MCSVLKFSRSTYYAVKNRKISKKTQQYQEFSDKVKSILRLQKKIRCSKNSKKLEFSVVYYSLKRVQRHMQRLIRGIVTFKYQQNSGKLPENKENLLNRDFKASSIFQKLVTDITYIHVKPVGWTYLASVMDLYSRKILGYFYG